MSVVLPKSWEISRLGDFVFNANGARKPISLVKRAEIKGDYPYYGATGQIDSLNNFTHEGEHVLIGEDGANLLSKSKDLAFIVKGQFWVNNHAHAIKCVAGVPSEFLAGFINSLNLTPYVTGSAQPKLTKTNLENIKIPVPPLAEQKQIAAKLDGLLAQVDTLKTRLDTIPTILKRFRQSVLSTATTGNLTEEWREENYNFEEGSLVYKKWLVERRDAFEKEQTKLMACGKQKRPKKFREPVLPDLENGVDKFPSSWATVSVSQFSECLDQIRIPVKKEHRTSAKGLYPYFGANGEVDRVDEYLFDDELVLVTEDETFYGRIKPIAYRYSGKCWVNNHAHVLRAPTRDANDFLCYSLMYYNVIPWLSGTTGRAKLTQAALNSLPMGLPPEEEQTEIVQRVKQFFTFADQIEKRVKNAQEKVNNLTQSILAKAFHGELTEEWREQNSDLISGKNSADALLEKIKLEREKFNVKTIRKIRKKMVVA